MQLLLLYPNFDHFMAMLTYKSLIWTERYDTYGDFELTYKSGIIESTNIQDFVDKLVYSDVTDKIMIIDSVEVKYDDEDGYDLILSGRSLEYIPDRRIIWNHTILTGNLQDGIERLLNENIINPTDTARKIDNFIFVPSTDSRITELTIDAEYYKDNLQVVISNLCQTNKLGYKITYNEETGNMEFSLYAGTDRSMNQDLIPYAEYSTSNGVVLNSNYYYSKTNHKNVISIESDSLTSVVGSASGLDRRETYVNSYGLSSIEALNEKGAEELLEYIADEIYDIESDNNVQVYREDYYLGDLVQTDNTFGQNKATRVKEFIYSIDEAGITSYPTVVTDEEIIK